MENKIRKYARFLVEGCLGLNKSDKLFIIGNDFIEDFINIVKDEARKLGISDIDAFLYHPDAEKTLYMSKPYKEIINSPLIDKTKFNKMAREGYAFLNLTSTLPNFYQGVQSELLNKVSKYQLESISEYKEYQMKGLIKWNISAVPNKIWAKDLFGSEDEAKLWDLIFDICLINEEDPVSAWNSKMAKLESRAKYLNSLDIDKLVFKNSLGTNIEIGLPDGYLFESAASQNIVNMPTEEIFASPHYLRVNGRVYSSKVLYHNNRAISDFWLEFKDGKVIDYDALLGKDVLKGILETDEGSKYLGEVALVDASSLIAKSNVIFKNTLYDENASCHLALGAGFPECIKDGLARSDTELKNRGINNSKTHVDFFFGTEDLEVKAILKNNKEVIIMEKGNFKRSED